MPTQNAQNFLVPATGTTHQFVLSQVLSATPFYIDFRLEEINGQSFIPSGVFIDNSAGTGPVRILVNENSYNIVCAAGQAIAVQYPAPIEQSVSITGLGQATLVFVDFPVIPFLNQNGVSASAVSIANGADVAQGSTTDAPQAVMATAASATEIALLKGIFNQLLQNGNGQFVQGNVASATADAGNPVKVGGVALTAPIAYTTGQRADALYDLNGFQRVRVAGHSSTGGDGIGNGSMVSIDLPTEASASAIVRPLAVGPFVYNGASWDRAPGNTVGAFVQGAAPAGGAPAGNLFYAGMRALNVALTYSNNTVNAPVLALNGAQTSKPYSVPELDWSYGAATGGITNTTAVAIKAAAGAGVRNYLTGISITNASATIPTEVVVLDGATPIWRGYVGSNLLLNSAVGVQFSTPLKSTANAALNVQCVTTGAAVYVNAQGYVAP